MEISSCACLGVSTRMVQDKKPGTSGETAKRFYTGYLEHGDYSSLDPYDASIVPTGTYLSLLGTT